MRLLDAVVSVQAQSAVKDHVAGLRLLDEIGQDPVSKTIQPVIVFQQIFTR